MTDFNGGQGTSICMRVDEGVLCLEWPEPKTAESAEVMMEWLAGAMFQMAQALGKDTARLTNA